ncbi:head-tail adaptor protein [Clostridium botulinum]|uniref:phage head closure protein n=1 Tax=Clostridium TaxID=1485 RepID=UPI0013FCEEA8|nr:phage head closure protein [Clostridium sporogenes]MCW6106297.1 phage head closure protein [Clostridium sporogenes]NFK79425.1 head-tail adaptor protein [Clostridium botulinum]
MNTGDLKHRVTFQRFTAVVNDNGFEEEIWQDYKTVWTSVSNLYGREYFEAAAIQAEKTVKFTIRFINEIDKSMRIKFRDRQYNITSIDNIKYANKFIEIKAMEVDKSG